MTDGLLDLDLPEVRAHTARCRACKRKLRDPESLGFVIGPTCRKRLGIGDPRWPRVRVSHDRWAIVGQTDLLEEIDG